MNLPTPYILMICFLYLFFPSDAQEFNYTWDTISAESSPEQLKEYRLLYDREEVNEWDNDQRIAFLRKGLAAAEKLDDQYERFTFSQMLGNRYYKADSFSQAIKFLKYPIENSFDTLSIARTYNRLGYIYFVEGDYSNSLDHFFNAVKFGKLLNNGWETYPFGNITNVYKQLEDYDNAIKYTKASIEIDAKADSPEREYGLIYNYTNLLIFNDKKNLSDSCLYYIGLIDKNISVIDTIDNRNYRSAISYAHITIADFYQNKNELELTQKYLALAKKDNNRDNAVLHVEGRYWLKKKNLGKVKEILQEYDSLNIQNFGNLEKLYQLKIDYYTAINDFQNVAKVQQELFLLQKEKFGNDRLRYSAFANAQFKSLEQQQRISDLENKRQISELRSRNRNFIFLLIFLVISGFTAFFWYRSRKNKRLSNFLDEQVKIKTQDLAQANYELRTFYYIASHDIKEPIRNISNYASLIARKLPQEWKEQTDNYFKIIQQGTKQLYYLIEDFGHYLKLSKDKNIKLQKVQLDEVIETLQQNLEPQLLKTNGKIINKGLPAIPTNSSLMYIILKNLIDNGLKFNHSKAPTVEISYQSTESYHNILVIDNGKGIEEKYFDKVFEMFSKLQREEQFEGSGIGLAIVKLLLQKLNGKISIQSQINKGSTFIIQLPKN